MRQPKAAALPAPCRRAARPLPQRSALPPVPPPAPRGTKGAAPGPPPPGASHVGTEKGPAPYRRPPPRLTCLLLPYGGFAAPRWYRRVRILPPPPPAPPPAPPPPPEAMLGRGPSAARRPAGPLPRSALSPPVPRPPRAARPGRSGGPARPAPPLLSPPPRSAKLRSAGLPPRARAHPFSSAVRAPPLAPLPRALCPLPPRALGAGRPRPARPLARGRAAAPRPHPPSGSGFGSDQPHCASRQPDAPSRHSAATDRRAPRRGVGGAARETPARARGAWAVGERSGKGDQSGRGTASLGGRGEGRSAARPALPRKEIRLSVVNWKHVK